MVKNSDQLPNPVLSKYTFKITQELLSNFLIPKQVSKRDQKKEIVKIWGRKESKYVRSRKSSQSVVKGIELLHYNSFSSMTWRLSLFFFFFFCFLSVHISIYFPHIHMYYTMQLCNAVKHLEGISTSFLAPDPRNTW